MRKFDEPSFAALSIGRARVNQDPPVHQCGWMVHWWVVPFSSLPVPGLTQVVNSSWPFLFPFLSLGWFAFGTFFFPQPPCPPRSHLPTCIQTTYLCTLACSLPHLPTCPPIHPSTYLFIHMLTYPSTYLPMYICTKFAPRQWWHKFMKIL
jgi:hypothetical protein